MALLLDTPPPALANSWLTASSCTVWERRLQLPQYLRQVLLFSWEISRGFNLPCLIHPSQRRPKNKGLQIKLWSLNFLCCIIALQYNKRSTVFGEMFSYFICDLIVVFIEIITQDKWLKIHNLLSNVILLVKYKLTIYILKKLWIVLFIITKTWRNL